MALQVTCGGKVVLGLLSQAVFRNIVEYNRELEKTMASRSFFVELKVNFDDQARAGKEDLLKNLMVSMARVLKAKAMLIADRSEPKINIVTQTALDGPKEIDPSEFPPDDGVCPCCGRSNDEAY